MTGVVTAGYSPLEQYSQKSRQGAYTDVYALCATMYHAISGVLPPASIERNVDDTPLKSFMDCGVIVPRPVEQAIMHGLALKSTERTQTMGELLEEIGQSEGPDEKPSIYAKACALQSAAKTEQEFRNAIVWFKKASGYRDADIRVVQCERCIDDLREAERRREKKMIRLVLLIVIIIGFVTSAIILSQKSAIPGEQNDGPGVSHGLSTEITEVADESDTGEASVPKAVLTMVSAQKEYDGKPLTESGINGYTLAGSIGDYELVIVYNSITEVGTVDTARSYELRDKNGKVAFTKKQLDASQNFTVNNGQLTVNKRPLKLIAISGTLSTDGENISATSLSTPDGSFTNGYSQIGLLEGQQLSGNFVQGFGRESFKTSINPDEVRITADGKDVTRCYDIQTQDGYITINASTSYDLIVNPRSYTWTYDGTAHSMREYDYSGLVNGDKLVRVNFSNEAAVTNVGTRSNRITSVMVTTAAGGNVDVNKYVLISMPGTLTVQHRDLIVTAISATLTTSGETIIASDLSSPDGTFKNGYNVENLAEGHRLEGNFVTGSGTDTFATDIDLNQLRVVNANGEDVTDNYNIRTVNGSITINTINSAQQNNHTLSLTAKSGSFTYDGTEHSLTEYAVRGLVDGDVVDRVTFKSSSALIDAGTRANEIQSVVIKSSDGSIVDNRKYNINYYSGVLTVTKAPLTLTAVSDEKIYDGKALNNKNVKATTLANSNHTLSADYEVFDSNGNSVKNGPVDLGVYTKKVTNVKITSGNTDVTDNYDIKLVDGTLKITGSSGESSRATATTAYYGNTFTIRSDARYSEFEYLLIDGQKVSTDNYTVEEGSTIITLKSSYIQSLKKGEHNYTIVSSSKQVEGSFTVQKS